jgi:hypothetical protein
MILHWQGTHPGLVDSSINLNLRKRNSTFLVAESRKRGPPISYFRKTKSPGKLELDPGDSDSESGNPISCQ